MENMIVIDPLDEKNTDELLRQFVRRYRIEKGRFLTEHERNLCWWSIAGVVMRDGYEAGKDYVERVKLEN